MAENWQDFMLWLRAEPQIMPAAGAPETAAAYHRRVLDEIHDCLRCGSRAVIALTCQTRAGPRWLDLCAPCAWNLHREIEVSEEGGY